MLWYDGCYDKKKCSRNLKKKTYSVNVPEGLVISKRIEICEKSCTSACILDKQSNQILDHVADQNY